MKKLLIVLMVLSMASMAQAMLSPGSLSMSAASNTLTDVGQSTTLSISSLVSIAYLTGGYEVLVVPTAEGVLDASSYISNSGDSGMTITTNEDVYQYLGTINPGDTSILATLAGAFSPTPFQEGYGINTYVVDNTGGLNAQTLYSNIKFTSSAVGAATISMYYLDDDYTEMLAGPTVTITTQGPPIPEPMTIGLLGLGGLFLRRRK